MEKIGNLNLTKYVRCHKCGFEGPSCNKGKNNWVSVRLMNEIKVICSECKGINTMGDFGFIHNATHEKCSKCDHIQEMSLVRCLKKR